MATLAAANVASRLRGEGVWGNPEAPLEYLEAPLEEVPRASPSIVNASELGIK